MFADDTNLFLTHKDISYLFEMGNFQLQRINQWFISNKLPLNVSKTKYSFFHKPRKRHNILLLVPKLDINNSEIERYECLKFLRVLLDARNFICRCMVRQYCSFVLNPVVNYHLVVSCPQQCHVRINVGH